MHNTYVHEDLFSLFCIKAAAKVPNKRVSHNARTNDGLKWSSKSCKRNRLFYTIGKTCRITVFLLSKYTKIYIWFQNDVDPVTVTVNISGLIDAGLRGLHVLCFFFKDFVVCFISRVILIPFIHYYKRCMIRVLRIHRIHV